MNFGMAGGEIPEEATRMVLGSLGEDILVFLTASVLVTTICNAIGVTPILGYLIIGAILGSNGLNIFANQQAGVELGDFGILFLLFSEGLDVTSARLLVLRKFHSLLEFSQLYCCFWDMRHQAKSDFSTSMIQF
jgi:Kef-type K+ transport system membrane component KefB